MRKFNRVLITGITGSGGSYLAEHIVENFPNTEVHGISRWHSTTNNSNLDSIKEKIRLHEADLNDFSSILQVLNVSKPEAIFHIAAHANVRASFQTPLTVINNNIMGTANLFEAIRALNINPYIQLCSTSEVYGQVSQEDIPIKENTPFKPSSPYAVSKVAQDLLAHSYFAAYKMPIIVTRMFAYLNPRRTDLFATSFARQIARIESGLQNELIHGNLDSVRTIIDVRDAMSAYWDALKFCNPGEAYNIGGKKIISVGEFLELLKQNSYIKIKSRLEPSLLRPADVTLQIPCTKKFEQITRWKPKYSFEESVKHLLNQCRLEVRKELANGK